MFSILKRPGDYILIGRQGEHNARQICFDISHWQELYGAEGRVELIYQRPKDAAPYPVVIEREGSTAMWTVTATDTANNGYGRAELRYYIGDTLAKSATSIITVSDALDAPAEIPDPPGQNWLDQVLEAAQRAEDAADRAEGVEPGSGGGSGGAGTDGADGATFTPTVSEDGTLSWTNDKGLDNPAPVNIKGPKGNKGDKGDKGDTGATGAQGADGGYYTPKVSQPTAITMLVEQTPSKAGMPAVEPVTINLPVGEDSSQNASIPTSADLNGTTATFRNSAGVALFTLDLSGLGGTAATYGNLVLSAEELTITEGQSGTFTVALDTAPSVNQPVYLAVSDGTRLSVAPATLTFTPEDWETPQTVTVTSLEDDDELDNAITVTLTSESVDARQVAVAITKNDGEFYELFNGKQVVSMILAEDIITSDTAPLVSYTDSATGETLSNDSQKLVWPFKSGVGTNLAGTPTKARTVLEANTSGAYSVLFVGTNVIADNSQSNWFTGIAPAIRNYFGPYGWDTLAPQLSEMRYTTASGEQSSVTITSTDLEVLMTDLPDWFVHIVAFSFESDGTIVVIMDGIEVYRTDAPVDFAAWDWDLDGHAWNELAFKLTPSYGSIIVNDALSAAEIDEFYTKYLAANFTSGETA